MLWGTQWAFAIEAWRARSGRDVPAWLEVIGEFEALVALGTYAREHPANTYPEICRRGTYVRRPPTRTPDARPRQRLVTTSRSAPALRLVVVSGSNMSGKSTWLRTIGRGQRLGWTGGAGSGATPAGYRP